ncbi:aminotransferase class I/II-fold pyridoxal phosphate-dependent enzyme [Pyramidobacter sp. SM-530-WT-4B]|uniref:Aminotransferase class I/II-fold pyridoxal phosphate-dependent enzyme n=1 Tax=Pyramidobacter porci TaxID=2605789 RepID=A0A6L5YA66_9BACT|nr:aminotransferase class I/II-fold pyridoxal phosphate-dependent enzyme [Pyramidobacter porci]MST55189.1 aminotransferase class I/II-fold pyridoxal phosphate-dependent enzyme [Pyramidobacter porci]
MIRFNCDYSEGCHPAVLEALVRTNMEQTPGYGEDAHCERAAALIRTACAAPEAAVHFLVGGTQANFVMIAAALRPHQAAVCAGTGHINVHESGAVEATGHKVIAVPGTNGKISAAQVRALVENHWDDVTHEHMAQPKLVYVSNPTELGTIYSLAELTALHDLCREKNLYLYLDGARLGYALAAAGNDLTLADVARLTDAFYIGGTKVGALFGEALVITNEALKEDFRYIEKQRGAMLAKGRLLGVQFETLFTDGLYLKISRHAVDMAMLIRDACRAEGWEFLVESPTNQQFPIVPVEALKKLGEKYAYSPWAKIDGRREAVRFCTSWATREEDVRALAADIAGS